MHVSVLDTHGPDRAPKLVAVAAFDVLITDHVPATDTPLAARILLMSSTHGVTPGVDDYLPDRSSPADLVRAGHGAARKVRPPCRPCVTAARPG